MENEERIKLEMQETRSALAEKLETLEQKVAGVVGTVEDVTTVVSDTVGAIKETMQDTKETVSAVNEKVQESVESVKGFLDVKAHVQEHPWLMVGGSVAFGYCLGVVLEKSTASEVPRIALTGNGRRLENAAATSPAPKHGLWDAEIAKLKGLALGALFGTAREMIAASLPDHVGHEVKEIIDSVTTKVGGEPIPSSAFADMLERTAPGQSSQSAPDPSKARRW